MRPPGIFCDGGDHGRAGGWTDGMSALHEFTGALDANATRPLSTPSLCVATLRHHDRRDAEMPGPSSRTQPRRANLKTGGLGNACWDLQDGSNRLHAAHESFLSPAMLAREPLVGQSLNDGVRSFPTPYHLPNNCLKANPLDTIPAIAPLIPKQASIQRLCSPVRIDSPNPEFMPSSFKWHLP